MSEDAPQVPPPYVIRTERLTLRCWEPGDAPLLGEALDSSLDHLRPWMPWADDEPTPLDERIDRLRRFRGMFDLGQNFIYGLFTRDETEVVGGSGLHPRVGEGALEIGYWLRTSRVGAGLAREAAAALTCVAFRVCEVDRVEIRIDPANERSLGSPARSASRRRARSGAGSPPEPTACRATWSSSWSSATISRAWR